MIFYIWKGKQIDNPTEEQLNSTKLLVIYEEEKCLELESDKDL